MNPRDETTDLGEGFDTMTRRLLRRGIPYGPSLPRNAADDGVDRGLLFLAYQASIVDSFEKIINDWTNNDLMPQPKGHDPLIGQSSAPGRARAVDFAAAAGAAVTLKIDREWVFPTGGGYFFAPSRSALGGRLAS